MAVAMGQERGRIMVVNRMGEPGRGDPSGRSATTSVTNVRRVVSLTTAVGKRSLRSAPLDASVVSTRETLFASFAMYTRVVSVFVASPGGSTIVYRTRQKGTRTSVSRPATVSRCATLTTSLRSVSSARLYSTLSTRGETGYTVSGA